MEAELRQAAGEHVIFAGYVPDPCLYYQTSDLFILPSETEGLSNAMLEAMACGLPVAATRVGAAVELVRNGENGRLVTAGDNAELSEALEFFLSKPKEGLRMGRNGMELVRREYSLDQTVEHLTSIYLELAGGG